MLVFFTWLYTTGSWYMYKLIDHLPYNIKNYCSTAATANIFYQDCDYMHILL